MLLQSIAGGRDREGREESAQGADGRYGGAQEIGDRKFERSDQDGAGSREGFVRQREKVGARNSRTSDLHAGGTARRRSGQGGLPAGRGAAGRLRRSVPEDEREVPRCRRMADHGARSSGQI